MKRALVLAMALAMAGAASAQDAMTAAQVRAALTSDGYTNIHDVEFDDGVWKADVTSANGKKMDVRLDPKTGKIYPDVQKATNFGEADVRAKLSAAGYTKIDDVNFDDGLWQAEADDSNGQRMDLKLDPADGRVISATRD